MISFVRYHALQDGVRYTDTYDPQDDEPRFEGNQLRELEMDSEDEDESSELEEPDPPVIGSSVLTRTKHTLTFKIVTRSGPSEAGEVS